MGLVVVCPHCVNGVDAHSVNTMLVFWCGILIASVHEYRVTLFYVVF